MRSAALLALACLASACASFEVPPPPDEDALRVRAERSENDGIRVTATLLTPDEIDAVFGVDLLAKGIEPVWMEIENTRDQQVYFLISGMDPEYFAPLEVAHLFRKTFGDERNDRVSDHLVSLAMDYRAAIEPGTAVRGFAYTNATAGAKVLDVDLLGDEWSTSVTLFLTDPANEAGRDRVTRIQSRFSPPELVHLDDAGLRAAIEGLPCCAENADGDHVAPLNLVLIGELKQGLSAFQRRGYRFSEDDVLHAFQRPADSAGTKTTLWVDPQPQVVRLWQTPLRYGSRTLWLGQVSLPAGGRFAREAGGLDRYVDRARDTAVEDLLYSQHVVELGRAGGAGCSRAADVETDGLRWVLMMDERAIALDELEFFDWSRSGDGRAE